MVAIELLSKGRDFDPMKRLLICLLVAAAAFGQTRTASCNGTQQYTEELKQLRAYPLISVFYCGPVRRFDLAHPRDERVL